MNCWLGLGVIKDRPGSRQNPGPGQNWPILWNPGPGQNREICREFDRDLYRILKFQFSFYRILKFAFKISYSKMQQSY